MAARGPVMYWPKSRTRRPHKAPEGMDSLMGMADGVREQSIDVTKRGCGVRAASNGGRRGELARWIRSGHRVDQIGDQRFTVFVRGAGRRTQTQNATQKEMQP